VNIFKSVANFFEQRYNNLWTPTQKFSGMYWYPIAMRDFWLGDKVLNSFLTVPELNAIINLNASSFSNGVMKVVDNSGKEIASDPVNKILRNPNWFQGQKEFMRQTKLFHDIYGNEYLYIFFPKGFEPQSSLKALYTLPPNLVEPEIDDKEQPFFFFKPDQPPKITYNVVAPNTNKKFPLSEETIIHLTDNKVHVEKLSGKSVVEGTSKIKALAAPIKNIKMAYESRGIILKYRGALGILSNGSSDRTGHIPIGDDEINEIQNKYLQYGGLDGQFQVIITNANLKWQQMAVSPDKLGLFQETEEDFNKMLDTYNVPSELFVRQKGATFENRRQAEKNFYQNNVIPYANEFCGALNNAIFPDNDSRKIVIDYTHLPIFQEDLKLRAETVSTMVNALSKMLLDSVITVDEYKIELSKFGIGTKPI
jgi:phage portal protein BeeE